MKKVHVEVDAFPEAAAEQKTRCRVERTGHACDAFMFGSLVLGLLRQGISPNLKAASDLRMSLQEFQDKLKTMEVFDPRNHIRFREGSGSRHATCDAPARKMKDAAKGILLKIGPVALVCHKRHMRRKRADLAGSFQTNCRKRKWEELSEGSQHDGSGTEREEQDDSEEETEGSERETEDSEGETDDSEAATENGDAGEG